MSTKSYVLVVDDEESGRAPMVALLEELGVEVRQAEDGAEALAHIQKEIPGFVVLDLLMPEMDGFSVLGRFLLRRRLRIADSVELRLPNQIMYTK